MKNLSLKFIITIALFTTFASNTFSQTKEFTVDGIKVYYKQIPKQIISVRLFISGGTNNYSLDQQGIESLALSVAMNGGTTSKPKNVFNTEAEKIGTSFGSSSSLDYSEVNMTCIKPFWEKSWALFADAVMNPAFNAEDFDIIKSQAISGAKQREESPDAALQEASMSNVFKGRSYEKVANGTSGSLEKITSDAAFAYYKNLIGKSRCFLVVVGNLTQEEVTAKIKATLSKLPAGTAAKMSPAVKITQGKELVIERDIATNYVMGIMSSPSMLASEGVAMMVAMNVIDDYLFLEIRTKRGLSYAPNGGYNTNAITSPYSMIYASTDSPKKVIQVMVDLLNNAKENGISQEEIDNKKKEFLTTYLMGLETSASQSSAIGRWAVRGDVKGYEDFTNRVNAVTVKDVNRVIDQNTNAIIWTYLGKKSDVTDADFKQTTIFKNKPY